ncbi:MAG: CinA family protein [Pseudomonadota bacterium]
MLDQKLIELVKQIKSLTKGRFISTAESCTGGLVASYLTSISGSSDYFATGIVSYSNAAKMKLLNVNSTTLDEFGAVSEEVAKEMADGCLKVAGSDIAVSITGVAGLGGGTKNKPVGMVCFGIAAKDKVTSVTHYFSGTRTEIRQQSCEVCLRLILDIL